MTEQTKIKVQVAYESEKASASALMATLKQITNQFGDLIGAETSKEIQSIQKRLAAVSKQIEKVGDGPIDPKLFKEMNRELQNVNKMFKGVLTNLEETIEFDVDTSKMETDIEAANKKVDALKAKINSAQMAGDPETSKVWKQEKFTQKMQETDLFAGFTGNTSSLGDIKGLTKNRTNFELISKSISKLRERFDELRSSTKLTAKEQKELNEMYETGVEEKLPVLEDMVKQTNEAAAAEVASINEVTEAYKEEKEALDELIETKDEALKTGGPGGKVLSDAGKTQRDTKRKLEESEAIERVNEAANKQKDQYKGSDGGVTKDAANELIEKYFTMNAALSAVKAMARKTIDVISELDAAFVSIAVVTQYTNEEVWGMYEAFNSIASASGFTTAEIGQVASEYFRQGESLSNVLVLTEAAAKAAKVAGIDASDSVRYLTSAVRAYRLEASDAMMVSDKFAALAASTATDYEGLATAMSKVAAQASSSGVGMDNLMGMMATAMDVTQEAPENIGTAFKTILARMSEIKDYGKVLEDGVDANRVEKALKLVNVQLFDQNNEMRALDEVLLEVGGQWGGLNKSQKAYLATSLAGTRQQTRLLAVMENMDRVEKNIQTSRDSAGATNAQQLKNVESLAFAMNKLNVTYQKFTKNISGSKLVLGIINTFSKVMEGVVATTDNWLGKSAFWISTLTAVSAVLITVFSTDKVRKFFSSLGIGLDSAKTGFKLLTKQITAAQIAEDSLAAGSSVTAGSALGSALGTGAMLVSLGVLLIGAAHAAGFFDSKLESVQRNAKKLNEELEKTNGELYNLKKSDSNLKELVNEYKELDKLVVKTEESMKRQKDILQLIKDMDVQDKYINVIVDGELNKDIVDGWYDDLEAEIQKKFEEETKLKLKFLVDFEMQTEDDQRQGALAKAAEELVDTNYKELEKLTEEKGEEYVALVTEIAADAAKGQAIGWRDSKGNVFNDENPFMSYHKTSGKYKENRHGIMQERVVSNDDDGWLKKIKNSFRYEDMIPITAEGNYEDAEKYLELVQQVKEEQITPTEFLQRLKEEKLEYLAKNKAIYENSVSYGVLTDSYNTLAEAQSAFNIIKEHGVNLSEREKEAMVSALDSGDAMSFYDTMSRAYEGAKDSQTTFAQGFALLQEEINGLSFENMVEQLKVIEDTDTKIMELNESFKNYNSETLTGIMALMDKYMEFPEVLEVINQSVLAGEGINLAAQEAIANADKEKTLMMLKNTKALLKAEEAMLIEEIAFLTKMIQNETAMKKLASEGELKVSQMSAKDIIDLFGEEGGAYVDMLDARLQAVAEFERKKKIIEAGGGQQSMTDWAKRYNFSANYVNKQGRDYQAAVSQTAIALDGLTSNLTAVQTKIDLVDDAFTKVGDNKWSTKAADALRETGSAAKEAAKELEYYTGQMNKLYLAQQKLEIIDWNKSLAEAEGSYLESSAGVAGLPGAVLGLSDRTSGGINSDMYIMHQMEREALENLIEVSKEYQEDLKSGLDKTLRDSVQIVDGKVIPVISEYSKLTAEQMETVDKFKDSYNELTSEIQGYTTQVYAAAEAQNKLMQERVDTVIEYQKLMFEAIENEQKKEIEKFKKIIEANKQFLKDRKALYEEAFKEEDKEEEASDINEKRLEVIEKLASLEAAHDLTSVQRRESYKKELQELDDQYNKLMLDRNREALLQSLDDQITIQDEAYQAEEEAYRKRIESGEWLESRMKEIQDEARLQSIIDNAAQHWTIQQMLDNNWITQEELTRAGITDLDKTFAELNPPQQEALKKHWKGNRDIIDEMWNKAEGEVGAKKLTEDALKDILDYLEKHHPLMETASKTMKTKVLAQWTGLLTKVAKYTKDFNGTTITGPDYSPATKRVSDYVNTLSTKADEAERHYARLKAANAAAASANAEAARLADQNRKIPKSDPEPKPTPTPKPSSYAVGGLAMPNTEIYMAMATGGTTERTGLHWLDGKPGAPERVLSPGANKQFESLLATLTSEHGGGRGGDNTDVVNSLMTVVKAVYDSSQSSAKAITEAIDGIDIGDKGVSIRQIAGNHGISLNRRGDK